MFFTVGHKNISNIMCCYAKTSKNNFHLVHYYNEKEIYDVRISDHFEATIFIEIALQSEKTISICVRDRWRVGKAP